VHLKSINNLSLVNYGQTFPDKKHKQSNAHEKHKHSFPSENYNRTSHNKSIKNSIDSIPPRSL
jgi:hypothetical protein